MLKPLHPDALQRTYAREAPRHPAWPRTFEATMADPLYSRCLDMLTRYQVPAVHRRPPIQPLAPDGILSAPRPFLEGKHFPISGKMLAAGEKYD